MIWAKVLAALLGLASTVLGLLRIKKFRQEGADAVIQNQQAQVIDDVKVAQDARNAVDAELSIHPERLSDDDGFKRTSD